MRSLLNPCTEVREVVMFDAVCVMQAWANSLEAFTRAHPGEDVCVVTTRISRVLSLPGGISAQGAIPAFISLAATLRKMFVVFVVFDAKHETCSALAGSTLKQHAHLVDNVIYMTGCLSRIIRSLGPTDSDGKLTEHINTGQQSHVVPSEDIKPNTSLQSGTRHSHSSSHHGPLNGVRLYQPTVHHLQVWCLGHVFYRHRVVTHTMSHSNQPLYLT